MIRWPERLKWIEGKSSRIKYLQGLVREIANLVENFLIRVYPLPENGVYSGGMPREKKIIVSMTSYPKRIRQTYYAIKSIMFQSVKPDRIVLWLSQQQFPEGRLPASYDKLVKRGLEIRFTEDDLKSHKKYYYILQEQQPDEVVITFDDDLIYDTQAIYRLIRLHTIRPQNVVCNRGYILKYSDSGDVRRIGSAALYNDEGLSAPSFLLVPSTGAGCLYPYGIMPASTFVKKDIRELAFTADDIWIWYNCLRSGTGVMKTQKISRALCVVGGSQTDALSKLNDAGGENDRVLERMEYLRSPQAKEYMSYRESSAPNKNDSI